MPRKKDPRPFQLPDDTVQRIRNMRSNRPQPQPAIEAKDLVLPASELSNAMIENGPKDMTVTYNIELPNYKIHRPQCVLIDSPHKRKMIKAGRRGGKTTSAAIMAVLYFLQGKRVQYAAPVVNQTDRFWRLVKSYLAELIEHGVYVKNETERWIEPPGSTHQQIRAKTAWNVDNLRGDQCDLLILEEYQAMDEQAWEVVGQPMLMDHNGDALIIFTPPSAESRAVSKARDKLHATKLFRKCKEDPKWLCVHFPSMANPFLSADGIKEIAAGMTPLAYRQEILAEDTEDTPGALWTRKMIEDTRVRPKDIPREFRRIAIGVDPQGTNTSDTETGIVAVGESFDGHYYVFADRSRKGSPEVWAGEAVELFYESKADGLCVERNYGGDMVKSTVMHVDEFVPVREVTATRGKVVRAQPVAYLWSAGRAHIVGEMVDLEEQLCVVSGTMIATPAGDRPIESLRRGDLVITRLGPRRVLWCGETGVAPTRIIKAGASLLECSYGHPIFTVDRGFVRADNVARTDRLLICPQESRESMSFLKASGTFLPTTDISEVVVAAAGSYIIAKNIKNYAARFLADFMSTIRTRIVETIKSETSKRLVPLYTIGSMVGAVAMLSLSLSEAPSEKLNGKYVNHIQKVVRNAERVFGREETVRYIAAANVETPFITENIQTGTVKKLFNIHVEEAEEYFASGILVHNCTYLPDNSHSPDRMDAMVWAFFDLTGQGTLGLVEAFKSGGMEKYLKTNTNLNAVAKTNDLAAIAKADETPKCPSCSSVSIDRVAGGQNRCQACGAQWWPSGKAPDNPLVKRTRAIEDLSKRGISRF